MKYAFRSQVYKEPLETSLERLHRYGYEGVELLGEPDQCTIEELRELLAHYGLQLAHLNGDFSPSKVRDLVSTDVGIRRDTIEYCKQCIQFAHQLGACSFEVRPSPEGKTTPTSSLTQEWHWAVEALEELCQFAAPLQVHVAIEPANRYEVYMVNSIDDAMRMIEAVGAENLGILADCFHMNIEDTDIAQGIRKAGHRLLNVHLADSNRQPPGRGHTDFLTVMRTLKEIDYAGWLTMEPVPPHGMMPPADALEAYYEDPIRLMRLYERVT